MGAFGVGKRVYQLEQGLSFRTQRNQKRTWKYFGGAVFFRDGSISVSKVFDIELTIISDCDLESKKHLVANHFSLVENRLEQGS